jgi:threonine dehydratase
MNPDIKVFAVEPAGAADAHRSLSLGKLSGHEGPVNTIADGLRTTLGERRDVVLLRAS